jgi:hypothetical protein
MYRYDLCFEQKLVQSLPEENVTIGNAQRQYYTKFNKCGRLRFTLHGLLVYRMPGKNSLKRSQRGLICGALKKSKVSVFT